MGPKVSKMAKWVFFYQVAILALLSLCIDFKNSFDQMNALIFLKKCLELCPERINGIISSFPHRILKILLCCGYESQECQRGKISEWQFFYDSILFLRSVDIYLNVPVHINADARSRKGLVHSTLFSTLWQYGL